MTDILIDSIHNQILRDFRIKTILNAQKRRDRLEKGLITCRLFSFERELIKEELNSLYDLIFVLGQKIRKLHCIKKYQCNSDNCVLFKKKGDQP